MATTEVPFGLSFFLLFGIWWQGEGGWEGLGVLQFYNTTPVVPRG